MDSSMVKGVLIGGAVAVAVGAGGITGYKAMTNPSYAEVLAVKEVKETVKTPREECKDVLVQRQAPVKDENRVAGTVIGGIAGAALGSTIGRGSGRTVATVAGAAGGAYAGNTVQKNMQRNDTVTTSQKRCETVYDSSEKLIGYDVTYRLAGKENVVRMDHNPGGQIPLKDGLLVLKAPEPGK